jgi:hypothetical protein
MKAIEIIEIIKNESPDLLGKVPEKRAAKIIVAALSHIAKNVTALDQGMVRVQGLGVFRARQVEREKEGHKVMVKKVMFNTLRSAKQRVQAGEKLAGGTDASRETSEKRPPKKS